ncbi:MAG: TraB/GumN family protein [Cytophagaceae bacterium]|jgi:uncharacterized protein YbaP (TraB family)|nr:TraB/GumN family protein [Cytophagaceae bacterium]
MKKKLTLGLFFIVLFGIATAQKPADFTGSLLWKISGNDLKTPSYVFGTYHLLGKELMDSVYGLKEAFDAASQIIGEMDMADKVAMNNKMMQAAMLPEGVTYKALLSDDEYTRLDAGLKSILVTGLDQMGMLKPGMISIAMMTTLYIKQHPEFNPSELEAIDEYLQTIARKNNKTVKGLETIEEQVDILFNSDDIKIEMQALLCAVESIEFTMEQGKMLDIDYKRGDLNQMYTSLYDNDKNPCKEYVTQAAIDVLLKNRNDKWLEKLPALMADKPSLIVVGALHLAGEEGILYQLSQKGYTVEAVR